MNKRPDGQTQLVHVQQGPIAFDKTQVFQLLDPVRHRGRGKTDASADLNGGKTGIFLQFFQDMPVQIIQHFII